MRYILLSLGILGLVVASAAGAPMSTTQHGADNHALDGLISSTDLIEGQIGVEQPGDMGWHGANTQPEDKLPAFTDGKGALSGVTGLMNDFPSPGNPAKLVRYSFASPTNVGGINIFTGNAGADGRIWSTTVILYSTDNAATFQTLGYFQSDPSGTINHGTYGSTLVSIKDDAGARLLAGVTNIQFNLYAVDNSQGQMRDPFDGVNPFTGTDDGLSAPITSPLVYELDVLPVPEPAGLVLLGAGLLVLRRRTR